MAIPKFEPLANAGEGTKRIAKPILIGVVALLLGAFGLTATNVFFISILLWGLDSNQNSKIQSLTSYR